MKTTLLLIAVLSSLAIQVQGASPLSNADFPAAGPSLESASEHLHGAPSFFTLEGKRTTKGIRQGKN